LQERLVALAGGAILTALIGAIKNFGIGILEYFAVTFSANSVLS
jgi:hypothetical protein